MEESKLPYQGQPAQPKAIQDPDDRLTTCMKLAGLTPGELRVAKACLSGEKYLSVAHGLNLSEKTIKYHMANVYKKLGLQNRTTLFIWCLKKLEDKV